MSNKKNASGKSITDLQTKALALKNQADKLAKQTKNLAGQAQTMMAKAAALAKIGQTGDDKIRGFVTSLRLKDADADNMEKILRDMDSGIQKSVGQFMLAIRRTKEQHTFRDFGFDDSPREEDFHVVTGIYLGVLNGQNLIPDPAGNFCYFPTGPGAHCRRAFQPINITPDRWRLNLTDIYNWYLLHSPQHRDEYMIHDGIEYVPVLEIKIGDKEVNDWFESRPNSYLLLFGEMAKALGREIPGQIGEAVRHQAKQTELLKEIKTLTDVRKQRLEARFFSLGLPSDYVGKKQEMTATKLALDETENKIKNLLLVALTIDLGNDPLIKKLRKEYGL